MEAFEAVINLVVLMSALSIAAERVANVIKLRRPELRERKTGGREEKERERRIADHAVAAGIVIALLVKADFFAIVAHLEAPWETLGWAHPVEAARSLGRLVSTVCGTIVTGLALGFGSKFWHDVLDAMYGVRSAVRTRSRAGW
jgi:hypothetical protein